MEARKKTNQQQQQRQASKQNVLRSLLLLLWNDIIFYYCSNIIFWSFIHFHWNIMTHSIHGVFWPKTGVGENVVLISLFFRSELSSVLIIIININADGMRCDALCSLTWWQSMCVCLFSECENQMDICVYNSHAFGMGRIFVMRFHLICDMMSNFNLIWAPVSTVWLHLILPIIMAD